ncbi:hypothetical protein N7466_006059 [Penicillium verhagenii]|uniref:uncharacterized protein n=1 Tax=Penicillium verhagenii TaxID=1562060 RepID=UPI002545A984|nr:uncharacterized protein N7466_006059 [Penicillium verhagenii]KAJ5930566.1 hypothetical protein N7466_006059 [Penicillium verhagenii]
MVVSFSMDEHGIQARFTITMDDAYDYKIGVDVFDPHTVLPEILTLGDQLSAVLQKKLSNDQQRISYARISRQIHAQSFAVIVKSFNMLKLLVT